MSELTITPAGHFLIRDTSLESTDRKLPKTLREAYRDSSAHGMFVSACEAMDRPLPASFEFARSIARLYLTALCKAAVAEPSAPLAALPPPLADLDRAVLQAPPMTGLEYLTPELLTGWWRRPRHLCSRRNRAAPRRGGGLPANTRPPVAVGRPRHVPPRRKQT